MLYEDANSGNKTNLASAVSQANAVWVSREMLMKMRFFSPPCPGCNPLFLLWRSQAYSFLVWLIGMNGLTCAAFRARPSFRRGLAPWPPCRSQSRRLMAQAPEVCLRKQLLILSDSLLVFPTDRLGLSRAPNWTVKTHRAVWYITVDTDRPRDSLPLSPHCCLEALMKICGHFRAVSHIIIHSHALVTLQTEQCFWWQRMF